MPIQKLIVQHGPRFTTIALASVHQKSLTALLEDRGIALMVRKSNASTRFGSLKACCTSRVARDLFDEWAEQAEEDPEFTSPPPSRRYFYVSAENQIGGPFDFEKMSELLLQQVITKETLTAAEGETFWTPLKDSMDLRPEETRLSTLLKVSHRQNGFGSKTKLILR